MAALTTVLCHGVVIFLVILLMFNSVYEDPLKYEANGTGKSIEGFLLAGSLSSPSLISSDAKSRKSTAISWNSTSYKVMMGVHLLKYLLLANLLLLCNDVALNPGPLNVINNNIELNEEDISSSHFNLNLGVKELRIGHWNVNHLTTGKFEQIKLYLLRLPVGRGGVINSPRSYFLFCFRCHKLGYRSWVLPLCIAV